MLAYYFRTIDSSGQPTGYMGMAFGQDKTDVFWMIDEYCDPYSVEILTARRGGYCRRIEVEGDEHFSHDHEISETEPLFGDESYNWRRPKWGDI
jgi:hypothetical protein